MPRKRRHACRTVDAHEIVSIAQGRQKVYKPRKLDAPVFLANLEQETEYDHAAWTGTYVTLRKAREMEEAGEAIRVSRETDNGEVTFFRRSVSGPASRRTPATLTLDTMQAVARQGEKDLSLKERLELDKFTLWPFEGDRRNAATVRPRVGERECERARLAMRRAQGAAVQPIRRGNIQAWHAPAEMAA